MGNFDKPYEELLFTDNFMFVKTMELYPEYCREMLELLLSVKIDKIESISTEKQIDNAYESKGVRLDVLVKDSNENIYDAEMQVVVEPDLPNRSRYYHSAINTDFLLKGNRYKDLKPVYVIFICVGSLNYEKQAPIYFFRKTDMNTKVVLADNECTVVVNSDYINNMDCDSISEELREFLYLVNKGKTKGKNNTLAHRIEGLVEKLKYNKEWRPEYMTLYEQMELDIEARKSEWLEEGKVLAYIDMIQNGIILPEKAAELLGMTVDEFNQKVEEYNASEVK